MSKKMIIHHKHNNLLTYFLSIDFWKHYNQFPGQYHDYGSFFPHIILLIVYIFPFFACWISDRFLKITNLCFFCFFFIFLGPLSWVTYLGHFSKSVARLDIGLPFDWRQVQSNPWPEKFFRALLKKSWTNHWELKMLFSSTGYLLFFSKYILLLDKI